MSTPRAVSETLATYPSPIEAGPLAVDSTGLVFVATTDHHHADQLFDEGGRGRRRDGREREQGDGRPALAATLTVPHGLLLESDTSLLIMNDNDRIRRVDLRAGA